MAETKEKNATVAGHFKTSNDMLMWQYRVILQQLDQIQLHSSDSTCPCSLRDEGEYCIPKHLNLLNSLGNETAAMDSNPDNSLMFFDLGDEAAERHLATKDHVCGKGEDLDLVTWARNWRKKIEPLYYACDTDKGKKGKLKLHEDVDLARFFEPVQYPEPRPVSFLIRSSSMGVIPPLYEKYQVELNLVRSRDWNITDAPQVNTSESAQKFFDLMRKADREWLLVICLDVKLRLVGLFQQAVGAVDFNIVSPQVLIRMMTQTAASSVLIAHNHPSGDPQPSASDRTTWGTTKDALKTAGFTLVDFMVVGLGLDYSFEGNRYLTVPVSVASPFTARFPEREVATARLLDFFEPRGRKVVEPTEPPEHIWQPRLMPKAEVVVAPRPTTQPMPKVTRVPTKPEPPKEKPPVVLPVKVVPDEKLKDYAGMNPEAAKVMGYPMEKPEIHVAASLTPEEKRQTVEHELVEMKAMKEGRPYWQAHVEATEKVPPILVKVPADCKDKDCLYRLVENIHEGVEALPHTIDDVLVSIEHGTATPSAETFGYGTSGLIRYRFQYRVVEADDLIVSHDPFTFAPNDRYPQELQPRKRERKSPQLQVQNIAQNLNPDVLLVDFRSTDRGAPIIGSDLVVESGNGRVMALILAADQMPENYARYREALRRIAPAYALDVATIDGMKTPVLVRVRLTDVDRKTFAEDCNAPVALEQSAIEKARTDAEKISVPMLRSIDVNEGESVEDAFRSPHNKPFVEAFLAKLPPNEQAKLVDAEGVLNQDGVRRAVLAVFVATFKGDTGLMLASSFFESTDVNVKNTLNGIAGSLGLLAQAEGLAVSGERELQYVIGDDLAKAVMVFARIKKTHGMTVEKYIAQIPLQERELTPFQERVLAVLDEHSRSGKRIAGILSSYAQKVIDSVPPGQATFMPGARLTKEEMWESAVKSLLVLAETEVRLLDSSTLKFFDVTNTLIKQLDRCNISEEELRKVLSWRPLQKLIALAVGKKLTVQLCTIGITEGFYQLTMKGLKDGTPLSQDITVATHDIPNVKRVYTMEPDTRIYEVALPSEEPKELVFAPQEVSYAPARREVAEQVAMFERKGKALQEVKTN